VKINKPTEDLAGPILDSSNIYLLIFLPVSVIKVPLCNAYQMTIVGRPWMIFFLFSFLNQNHGRHQITEDSETSYHRP